MEIKIEKSTQFGISLYLMVGIIYAIIQMFKPLWNDYAITHNGILGVKIFLTDVLFFPLIIIVEEFAKMFLKYTIYWYIIPIIIVVYSIHLIWSYFKSPISIEIKHLVLMIISLLIFVSMISTIVDYDENFILKNSNYKTILLNFQERTIENDGELNGVHINKDLSIFLVNQKYMDNIGYEIDVSNNLTTLGFIEHKDNKIFINYEVINKKYDNDSEIELSNTFIHELTHYLDENNKLGNDCDNYGFYGYNCGSIIPIKYIEIFDKTKDSIPENLRDSVDFNSVFYEMDYERDSWDDEIIARVNALCLELDETKNLNNVKVTNSSFCNEFTFTNQTIKQYNYILESFVINYADTFSY